MPHHRMTSGLLLAATLAWSTASAAQQTPPPGDTAPVTGESRRDQHIQRIRIEDAGSRIDELRVGGETQSIVVSPKGGMPSYDIIPGSASRDLVRGERGGGVGGAGTRVWKVLGF